MGYEDWVYYDINGKIILKIPSENGYTTVSNFSEGLSFIQVSDNAWKYIDKTGNIILKSPVLPKKTDKVTKD